MSRTTLTNAVILCLWRNHGVGQAAPADGHSLPRIRDRRAIVSSSRAWQVATFSRIRLVYLPAISPVDTLAWLIECHLPTIFQSNSPSRFHPSQSRPIPSRWVRFARWREPKCFPDRTRHERWLEPRPQVQPQFFHMRRTVPATKPISTERLSPGFALPTQYSM